jgi:hypothetical protein
MSMPKIRQPFMSSIAIPIDFDPFDIYIYIELGATSNHQKNVLNVLSSKILDPCKFASNSEKPYAWLVQK